MERDPYAYQYPLADAYTAHIVTAGKGHLLLATTPDRFLQNFRSVYQHGDSLTLEPHLFPHLPKDVLDTTTTWDAMTRKYPKWNWMGTIQVETDDLMRFTVDEPVATPMTVGATRAALRQIDRRASQKTLMSHMTPWKA